MDIFFRIVKLSSPNLNYLIISGATLLYISVYMYVFTAGKDQLIIQTLICNVRNVSVKQIFPVYASTCSYYETFVVPTVTPVVLHTWLHSVLCCHISQDMEGISHL